MVAVVVILIYTVGFFRRLETSTVINVTKYHLATSFICMLPKSGAAIKPKTKGSEPPITVKDAALRRNPNIVNY